MLYTPLSWSCTPVACYYFFLRRVASYFSAWKEDKVCKLAWPSSEEIFNGANIMLMSAVWYGVIPVENFPRFCFRAFSRTKTNHQRVIRGLPRPGQAVSFSTTTVLYSVLSFGSIFNSLTHAHEAGRGFDGVLLGIPGGVCDVNAAGRIVRKMKS